MDMYAEGSCNTCNEEDLMYLFLPSLKWSSKQENKGNKLFKVEKSNIGLMLHVKKLYLFFKRICYYPFDPFAIYETLDYLTINLFSHLFYLLLSQPLLLKIYYVQSW